MFRKKESSALRESCIWQVYVTKVCGELNLRRKILIPNIVIPPLQIRTLSEKLYITQKKSDFGRFQFVASKVILEF